MNCPNCKAPLDNYSTFCGNCGTSFTTQPILNASTTVPNATTVYSSTQAPAKKRFSIVIILAIISIIAIASIIIILTKKEDSDVKFDYKTLTILNSIEQLENMGIYNGTYEFMSMSVSGYEFDINQISELYGESITMNLKVSFQTCSLDMSSFGYNGSNTCKIEITNNIITLTAGNQTMTGTYDSAEKTITLDVEGVQMVFKKK